MDKHQAWIDLMEQYRNGELNGKNVSELINNIKNART